MTGETASPGRVRRGTFCSEDEAEIADFIEQTYAEHRATYRPGRRDARFSALTHDVPELGADRVRSSVDYHGTCDDGFPGYVFFLVHAGTIRIASSDADTVAGRGDVGFYPLRTPMEFDVRQVDVTAVRLRPERVHQVAEDITGLPADQVRLHATTPVSAAMQRYWRSVLALTAGALTDPGAPLDSPLLAEDLARTLASAALQTFPNTTTTLDRLRGPGAVGPASLRRAMAHLEAHAHEPVTLAEIAAAAGTSARALQHAFRRQLGTTPLGHLRRVRLERARRELRDADPTRETVASTARRWGFRDASRFAAAYQDTFGRLPSQDLRG